VFRASFESAASKFLVKGSSIPVVSIVIQGGANTLKTVTAAIKSGTPLVVVEGTGGAADCLAYAWHLLVCLRPLGHLLAFMRLRLLTPHNLTDIVPLCGDSGLQHGTGSHSRSYTNDELARLVRVTFPQSSAAQVEEKVADVLDAVAVADRVIIFSTLAGDNSGAGFDDAILRAVFAGSMSARGSQSHVKDLKLKLKHAMVWDRLDIAKDALQQIFAENNPETRAELKDVLTEKLMEALMHNSPAFVELYDASL